MKNSIKIIFSISCFFTLFSASAQEFQKMSYQAVIRNAGNALVANANVGMRISILQGSATGPAIYVETHNTTTNVNGLATIQIGGGTIVTGAFVDIPWSSYLFLLKTETDPTGGTNYTITGTSQLMSVPYALYAEKSGNAWGTSGNAGTNASFNFIGTTDDKDIVFKRNGVAAGRIGNGNVSLGVEALSSSTTGSQNTAIGKSSMYFNTSGAYNTAIGSDALLLNTTGLYNTASGSAALSYNTTGSRNTATGLGALLSNSTGNDNTSIGFHALYNQISANANTAIGAKALHKNTFGINNTATGMSALELNTTGLNNTATGMNALKANTVANNNAAFGFEALFANTSGDANTAIGTRSLSASTSGFNNTAIGFEAMKLNVAGGFNTVLGSQALFSQTLGNENTAIGTEALYALTNGGANTAIGRGALSTLTNGTNNIGVGVGANVPSINGSNQIRLGNANIAYFGCQVALSVTSDSRWKSDIKKTSLGLDFINKLNPVSYTRKNDDSKKLEYGFIAQEMDATLNQLDAKNNGIITKDDAGMYSVRYNDLLAPMVKAIQEQQIMIEQLKKEIEILKK